MSPRELYDAALSLVCELTELTTQDVLTSKKEDCTDARCVLVVCLSRYLTDTQIAGYMSLTRQGVCYLRHQYDGCRKYRWSVSINEKEIRKELESIAQV